MEDLLLTEEKQAEIACKIFGGLGIPILEKLRELTMEVAKAQLAEVLKPREEEANPIDCLSQCLHSSECEPFVNPILCTKFSLKPRSNEERRKEIAFLFSPPICTWCHSCPSSTESRWADWEKQPCPYQLNKANKILALLPAEEEIRQRVVEEIFGEIEKVLGWYMTGEEKREWLEALKDKVKNVVSNETQ